ncbi:MAG TPA: hypothetical protein VMW65_04635, partial [Chloroflexota bacterium]|nr:hypothetical protein [Chloroflexota bacterium]
MSEPTEIATLEGMSAEGPTAHASVVRTSGFRFPAVGTLADGLRATGPVAILYVALVLLLWLPFGPRNGMGYETTFAY